MMLQQEEQLSFIQKIQLNLHFKMCKLCRMFNKQSNKITQSMIEMAKQCSHHPHHRLSDSQKQQMQDEINRLINKKTDDKN